MPPHNLIDNRLTLRIHGHRQGKLLPRRGDLAAVAGVILTPGDGFFEIGEIGRHRHIVLPRLQAVVIPLPEAERRGHFDHAAAIQQPDEEVTEGVGIAIDIDGESSPAP